MIIELLNKLLFIIFFMGVLNIIREAFFFIRAWFVTERIVLKTTELIILGVSIAYVLSCIFTGIKI
jgi:hypothetical protein